MKCERDKKEVSANGCSAAHYLFAYPGARSRPIKEIDVTEKLSGLPATQGSMGLDVNWARTKCKTRRWLHATAYGITRWNKKVYTLQLTSEWCNWDTHSFRSERSHRRPVSVFRFWRNQQVRLASATRNRRLALLQEDNLYPARRRRRSFEPRAQYDASLSRPRGIFPSAIQSRAVAQRLFCRASSHRAPGAALVSAVIGASAAKIVNRHPHLQVRRRRQQDWQSRSVPLIWCSGPQAPGSRRWLLLLWKLRQNKAH